METKCFRVKSSMSGPDTLQTSVNFITILVFLKCQISERIQKVRLHASCKVNCANTCKHVQTRANTCKHVQTRANTCKHVQTWQPIQMCTSNCDPGSHLGGPVRSPAKRVLLSAIGMETNISNIF